MTNSKNTKRALLTSAFSLLICFAMLIGTTFAWFTDTAKTGINSIQTGKLDVVLEVATQFNAAGEPTAWAEVTENTELFKNVNGDDIIWEPGAGAEEYFRIRNNGNLALKYQFMTKYTNATKTEAGKSLADILQVQNIAIGIDNGVLADREIYADMTGSADVNTGFAPMKDAKYEEYLLPGEARTVYTLIKWNPTANDNDFNVAGGLSIDLGISVVATQYTYESDSNDNQYDKDAGYAAVWSGASAPIERDDSVPATVKTLADVTDTEAKTVKIDSAELLAAFAQSVNSGNEYLNYTVTLEEDIDLGNKEWTPIGTINTPFKGTFNGQNHTIYNLKITSGSNVGLFGHITLSTVNYTPGIQNLTLNNVTVNADNSGAFVGNAHTTTHNAGNGGALQLINLKLTGKVTVEGEDVGGIIGTEWTDFQISADNITVDVDNGSYIKGTGVVGGVFASTPHGHISNIKSNINVIASGADVAAGGIAGCAGWDMGDTDDGEIGYIICTGNVVATEVQATANGKYPIGKIVGKEANNSYWAYYYCPQYGSFFKNFTANNTIEITLTNGTVLTSNGMTAEDRHGAANTVDYSQSLVGTAMWDWRF